MHPLLEIIKLNPMIEDELEKSYSQQNFKCQTISFVNPFSYQLLRENIEHYQHLDRILCRWYFIFPYF